MVKFHGPNYDLLWTYVKEDGTNPFRSWLKKIDKKFQLRIRARFARIEATGNLGDSKKIKGHQDIYELRFTIGPAFRVYFALDGKKIILLLIGGDKSTQKKISRKLKKKGKNIFLL